MFERLKMLLRVTSLYVNRPKRLKLLKQIRASGLSGDDQERIIQIMRYMRLIRASDLRRSDLSEAPPSLHSSSASNASSQGQG
jgi:hypothetical protein